MGYKHTKETKLKISKPGKLNPMFVTGLSDGESYFGLHVIKRSKSRLGWQVMPVFEIELHRRDLALLEKIKAFFNGAGVITKTNRTTLKYRVSSVEQISKIIIPHFDKYSLITKKLADYLLFKEVIRIMEKKEHLTQDGLNKVVAIKSSLSTNKGLPESLKTAFPNIVPVVRPLIKNILIPDPNWLAGFSTGEGCFLISVFRSKNKVGEAVQLRFTLVQHCKDYKLMTIIKEYLSCGNLYTKKETIHLTVAKLSDITEKIIPLFKKHPVLGVKALDLADFCKVAELMQNKVHLTQEGIDEIQKIKSGMNRGRKLD